MAYVTYTTDAIVCGTYDRNTADRSYRLFTRELGMLYADARSVRLEKSKQRQALQDFSLIKVSLVKGKAGWKIGSVSEVQNYYTHVALPLTPRLPDASHGPFDHPHVRFTSQPGGNSAYVVPSRKVHSSVTVRFSVPLMAEEAL